jgi:hypothetical protein
VQNEITECQCRCRRIDGQLGVVSQLRRGPPADECQNGGSLVRTAESNIGAPVGIEELPSQVAECGKRSIEHGMQYRSSNQDSGD